MDPSAFFYTSCTRGDGWPALTRFHADLEYRLRAQEGYGISGALGAAMTPGTVPSSAIVKAGVMIALYSPRYFLDRGCGLEWAVIQSRMRRRANIEGVQGPGCLIPVCWKPVAERLIPQEVRRSESFPGPGAFDWLREQGLEALVSSSDPGADERYYVFVEQLTKSILEAGRAGLAPLGADEARDTLPAFGSAQGAAGPGGRHLRVPEQPDPRHESAAGEPRSVAISYVGADQAWADWMDGVLREEGHTVRQRRHGSAARRCRRPWSAHGTASTGSWSSSPAATSTRGTRPPPTGRPPSTRPPPTRPGSSRYRSTRRPGPCSCAVSRS